MAVVGTAGPVNQQDAARTAMEARITVQHLDPVVAGFIDPEVGVSMLADIDAHAASDGITVTSNGTIHAQRLKILKGGSPAPQPVDLTFGVAHSLKSNRGVLRDLALKTGEVAGHLSGTYDVAGIDPSVNLKLVGGRLEIDGLQALLPTAGVKLPNGSVLKGGTLTTALTITGSVKDSVIVGPVELDNTRLVGFDLGSRVSGMAALGGVKTGDATSIQTLRMNVRVTRAGVRTDDVYALLPALGELTGSGTVSPAGALDFRLIAKLNTTQGIGRAGVGLLTALNGMLGGAVSAAAKNGVPMRITGTTNDPVITADMKGLLEQNGSSVHGEGKQLPGRSSGQQNPLSGLAGLFGRRN